MSSPIQHSLNGLFVKYNLYKISAIALGNHLTLRWYGRNGGYWREFKVICRRTTSPLCRLGYLLGRRFRTSGN
jgi:hypothetical protein